MRSRSFSSASMCTMPVSNNSEINAYITSILIPDCPPISENEGVMDWTRCSKASSAKAQNNDQPTRDVPNRRFKRRA